MLDMYHGVMFDPDSVKTYKVFYGNACDVLKMFKPNSIHSIFSTAPVFTRDADNAEDNRILHELYYKILTDSGSLFTHSRLNVDMDDMGWIRQHDMTNVPHYTKSDNFYREFCDSPAKKIEDSAKARKITNMEINGADVFHDIMCNFYTPPGGITMDPTMGNGPHIISALQRGRRAIGIEMVVEQYDMAVRRLALYADGTTVRLR